MESRHNEGPSIPIRSDRYFKCGNYWYFTTREGVNIGPYDAKDAAVNGCKELIEFVCHINPSFSDTLKKYQSFTSH